MNFIEILKSRKAYPGYPALDRRTEMGKIRYQNWLSNGRPTNVAYKLHSHPKYLRGIELGMAFDDGFGEADVHEVDFAPSFTGEYPRDAAGRPVHPYAEQIFAAGLAIEGPGAYWNYGPNLCADPIVLGLGQDNKLKTVVIVRGDTGAVAFPGGFRDCAEAPMITAAREFHEETGIQIMVDDLCLVACVYQGIVADPRTTLNAWPETSAFAIILRDGIIDSYEPIGQDDAASARRVVVDKRLYGDISNMHVNYLKAAVDFYQEATHDIVLPDGSVRVND